jgi:hypothetical protein
VWVLSKRDRAATCIDSCPFATFVERAHRCDRTRAPATMNSPCPQPAPELVLTACGSDGSVSGPTAQVVLDANRLALGERLQFAVLRGEID